MSIRKTALITGITGQDGSYLAEFLLQKGYFVHGLKRRSSSFNTARIDHIFKDPHENDVRFQLHHGDLSDASNLTRIISEVRPDEVYNLGSQSHVAVSFESPEYTADIGALGTLRLLEAIRFLNLHETTRFYQASTSELFGLIQEIPQTEKTPFYPEGGGQISDVGKASNNSSVLEVKNVQKVKNTIIHHAVLKKGTVSIRDEYELEIDAARRGKITVNQELKFLMKILYLQN